VVLLMERAGSRMPFKRGSRHVVSACQIKFIVADATLLRLQVFYFVYLHMWSASSNIYVFAACLASGRLALSRSYSPRKDQKQQTHTRTPNYCVRGYDQFFCARQIYLYLLISHIACASYCWRVFVVCMRLGLGAAWGLRVTG
jgi:hypothetical protein